MNLDYQWSEGSLPPPGYYEYRIEIRHLSGKITFIPDYPQHDCPSWIENFVCPTNSLIQLYEKLNSTQFFTRPWGSRESHHLGGSIQSLVITLKDKSVLVPYDLAFHEQKTLQPVFDAVKDLVPHPIWERLFALREVYIQEHYL